MTGLTKIIKKWSPLVLIIALAAALRVSLLFFRGTLWFDELFSIHFSSLPSWAETWRYWTLETNPPLYTFILRFWLKLGDPANPFFTRTPALIFGLLGVSALYALGKKMFSPRVGLWATLLFSLSGIHIFTSSETRAYTLFALLAILSSYFFYRLIINRESRRSLWALYTVITILLLYSHLTAVVMVAAQFLILILRQPEPVIKKHWWTSQIIAGLAWLPWLVPWLTSKFNPQIAGGWFFDANLFGNANIFSLLTTAYFVDNIGGKFIYTLVMLFIVLGIILLAKRLTDKMLDQETKASLIYLTLWAGLPILATSLLGVFVPKYVLFAYPALYLLAGWLIDQSAKTIKQTATAAAIILLLILPSAATIATTTVFSWTPFIEYVESRETPRSMTMLAFPETLAFNHFYRGQRPVVGIYLSEDILPYEERIVRFNWNKQLTTEEELSAWLFRQIEQHQADKLFVIFNSFTYSWIQEILIKRGWTIDHKERAPGYTESYLYEMNAPKSMPLAPTRASGN